MRLHYILLFVLALFCKTIFATHAFPLVNYNFTTGPSGITVSGASNGATCGGGPYWMQIEVSCSPTGFGGVQPTCLINALTNWTGPGVTYVSYPFFNSLLNVPGYSASTGWADQCVQEPYNNILIPYSYFCPGTTMYFRAREAVYGTTSTGPWTAVNAFVVPGVPPVVCTASLTHSPFTTTLSPTCPGAKTLTILNPNCPLPCASPALAPSCITSTVYYKYYDNTGALQGITISPTLALPSVTATTTYSVFKVDSCGGNGVCPPKSSCNLPGGGWPQMTTIFISAPNIIVAATPATICPTTSSTLTATGGATYTWMPGSLPGGTVIVSPGSPQIYTVTATTSLSCVSSKTVQVTVSPAPVITVNTSTNVVCAGFPATLTALGATNYTWSTGANGSVTIVNPTITSTYTVVGGNGSCTGSNTITISVIGSPTVSTLSSTNTICAGSSVNLLAGGALTYTWQPGNLNGSFVNVSPAATTIYTVTGSLLSCTDTETIQINVSNGPTMTVVSSPTTICSGSGGSATLSATGALSYTWNPGAVISSSLVIIPTVTTNYFVTGVNAIGCVSTNTISYSVTPTPTLITSSSSTAVCAGSSATLSATGAASYTWNPGALTGGTVTVTPATTTTYTVIGANGSCTSSKTITLVVNATPTVITSASPTLICSGNSSTLTATGALNYTWNPGALPGGTVTVNPGVTTIYTVTGTNAAGCATSATRQVSVNITPTLNPISTPTSICVGGSATLSTSGAASYTWNPGALPGGTVTVSPSSTTVYTVTGATANCSDTKTISLLVNPIPTVNATASPTVICSGASATLTATGALTYTWNPGNISGNPVTVNPTITTQYTVTGSNGSCTSTKTVNLLVNPNPILTATASPTNICIGSSATLSSTGATSYTWNPGALPGGTVTVSPVATTLYTVTGVNGFSCTTSNTVNLIVTPIPTISPAASPATICATKSTTLTATGATNYTWNPGALTGSNAVVTPSGNTTYTVIGSSGACTSSATILITVNPNPTVTAAVSPTNICAGSSATLSSTGAISYTWTPGALSGGTVTVTPAANTLYTVTGANAFGCAAINTVNLIVTPIPTVNAIASPTAICAGGSSSLIANGATSYTWNPGALTGSIVNVSPATTTNYTVTGSNGTCSNTKTVTVVVNSLPTLTVIASPTAICSGASSTLTANGANAYNWLPGALSGSAIVVNPTVTTTYTVVGTSTAGCTNSITITLTVNPIPSLTVAASPTAICSGNSTTLTGTAANGGPFVSVWNPGAVPGATAVVSPNVNTVYTWSVVNSFLCSNTKTININVTTTPTVVASASSSTICAGASTTLSATGATSYIWNPGALSGGTITVNPTVTTTYSVTGVNGLCTNIKTLTITVNSNPTITAAASPTNICAGGSATLSSTGATSYTWNPGALPGGTVTVTPAATTLYTITGANAFGCTATNTVNLIVTPNPTLIIAVPLVPICVGNNATLTAIGANTYTWLPGGSTATVLITPLTASTVFTVIGSNGLCQATQTIGLVPSPNPTINVAASPTTICQGNSSTLTATGATTYSWNTTATGSTTIVSPTISTTYTVTGTDFNNCSAQNTVNVNVSTIPTLTATASATSICFGAAVTLTANGSGTYTWNPTGLTTATITDTPTITTTYTVSSSNAFGCAGTSTITVVVNSVPSLTVSPLNSTICSGYSTTLTAMGSTNYTWLPSGNTTSATVETPTVNTTYTVIGANGVCSSSFTTNVFITPLPANLTATTSGSITCTAQTVTLTGSSTSTNVSYLWNGPGAFTTTVQNPTVNVQGTYTFNVIDNGTGCVASVTLSVTTDSTIPSVTVATSGSITCANTSVTINATASSTNVSYAWTGPLSFTSSAQTFSSTQSGTYILTVTDLNSACSSTAMVAVGIHTNVITTASITPATCTGSVSNNDGTISLSNFTVTDKYDYVAGSTYNGSATYLTAATIPTNGIVTNTLANPTGTVAYTIRIFDAKGCFKDTTLILIPINCLSVNSLGIAKAVSTPTLNLDGSYDINYKVVVKNYGLLPLTDVTLTENLNNTFPLPSTFTLTSAPVITSTGSSLTIDPVFDGNLQTSLTTGLTSTLNIGQTDTIVFGVKIFTNGFFGPFNNSVIGLASPSPSVYVADSSQVGLDPDPDSDLDPTNNNIPTPIQFTPNIFFGITKKGEVGSKQADKTYDITYTITVHNLGNDTLKNITAKDSLFNNTIKYPATYTMKSGPVATGSLNANSLYNGNSDINLLTGSNIMAPGSVNTIIFTINVNPDTVTVFKNSAYGNALSSTSITVSDTSNTGNDPDSNDNGVWNEPADNVPTVLIIPYTDFFIPDGFSPNGDGKNDLFVIKGLPFGTDNVFTVYNRWGNKVYSKSNYDNTWNGTPNVNGTMGTEKLPPGTYYYILEFNGGDIKTTNGFIVIQY